MKKKGFSLGELVIALAVIGIISAIVAPMVHNFVPNKDKMRYMKAYNALTNVISEFVEEGDIYRNGNLSDSSIPKNPTFSECYGQNKFGCAFCKAIGESGSSSCTTKDDMQWSFNGLNVTLYLYSDNISADTTYTFNISSSGNVLLDSKGAEFVKKATVLKND